MGNEELHAWNVAERLVIIGSESKLPLHVRLVVRRQRYWENHVDTYGNEAGKSIAPRVKMLTKWRMAVLGVGGFKFI